MQIKVFKIRLNPEFLDQDEKIINDFLETHKISKTASSFIEDKENYWTILVYYNEINLNTNIPQKNLKTDSNKNNNLEKFEYTSEDLKKNPLNRLEMKILNNLKIWRQDKSMELNLPSFAILSNNDLIAVTKYMPNNINEFYNIKGYGDSKIAKYGDDILAIINSTL